MKSFMKRFIIFISLYLLVFFTVVFFSYVHAEESYAKAEEEWTIDKFKTLSYARVSGEVTHGDSLNFFILPTTFFASLIFIFGCRGKLKHAFDHLSDIGKLVYLIFFLSALALFKLYG